MSGVGSSLALATCETSHVLLAGMPGGFSRGSPVFTSGETIQCDASKTEYSAVDSINDSGTKRLGSVRQSAK